MPNYLSKVVYLTDTQYASLLANPNTAINGHKYDSNALYITNTAGNADTVNGHTINADVPYGALFTDQYHTTGTWDGMTYTAQSVNGAGPLSLTLPVISASKGGTGKTTLTDSANALINALATGDSPLTANDYVITQYVGGGTTTTTYHRRKASNVINATLVKAALGTNSTHNNTFLRKDGTWVAPPYPVTAVAGQTGNINAGDLREALGLSTAMHFIGVAANAITDGGTQDPGISGYSTKTAGDVIIDSGSSREYVWSTTGKWELLGGDSSYKTIQDAVNDPTAATTTSTTFIDTISQNTNGVITATKKTLPTASSSVAGITKVGASGGAAAYSHGTHVTTATVQEALSINTSSGSAIKALTQKGTFVEFGTSNLIIGTTSSDAMAGDTVVTNVAISANTTTNANYPIVFATSNKDTTAAKNEGLQKSGAKFYFNPSTGNVQATTFNGYTLAAASAKAVVTSIDTSASLPTSNAVKTFVEEKGYVTSSGVTSITLKAGAGITLDTDNTAITSTGTRTISINGINTTSGSEITCLTAKGTWKTFGTSNLTIGTTSSTAMAGNTTVTNVAISADTTTNKDYAVVFGTTPSDGTTPTAAKTEGLQKNIGKFYFNPSSGSLNATSFCVDEHVNLKWNSTDSALEFVFA